MSQSPPTWTDEKLDLILGNLLRYGVLTAAFVVLLGGVLFLYRHGDERPNYGSFQGEPAELRSVDGILAEVAKGRARGVIQLGVLLLIATPIARVIYSIVAFALQRDRIYVMVTLIVLAVLLYGLFIGGRG